MRRRLAISIAALPLLVPACFGSSSSDDRPSVPDFDGGAEGGGFDATAASPEAATPDASSAPVTVVVSTDQGPEPGVTVVFQDAAGNVLASVATDAQGRASYELAAGGQVTALLGNAQNVQLVTVEGVEPGDVLLARDTTNGTFANPQVLIDSFPAAPPAGTNGYIVNVGHCESDVTSPPAVVALTPECQSGGAFPVLVQAMNVSGTGSVALGYSYQLGNALPADGGTAHLSLAGGWSVASATEAVTVTNPPLPPEFGSTVYSELANGVPYALSTSIAFTNDGGVTNASQAHPGYPSSIQTEANVSANRSGSNIAVSAIATRSAPPADGGVSAFDLSTLLPLLDSVTLDATQPGRPTVSWATEAGSLAGASGTIVVLGWSTPSDGGTVRGSWTFVAPASATRVSAPGLPAAFAAWAPAAEAAFRSPANVIVVQGSFLTGYADLRSKFASVPPTAALLGDLLRNAGVAPPLPVNGTLRLTAFTSNAD